MLFSRIYFQVLFAGLITALPALEQRSNDRIARREEFIRVASTTPGAFHSSNWAGAVITDSSAQWQSVSGQFVMPQTLGLTFGLRAVYLSMWVGVDGFTCSSATIKAGVDIVVKNGAATFFAWDEFFPGQYNAETNSISFSPGQTVNLIAIANISGLHEAEIQNLSGHVSVGRAFSPGPTLCQTDAIWGIEAWQVGDVREPFSIQFTNAQAQKLDGTIVGPGSAAILGTEENGSSLSSCSTTSSTVTCSFPQP